MQNDLKLYEAKFNLLQRVCIQVAQLFVNYLQFIVRNRIGVMDNLSYSNTTAFANIGGAAGNTPGGHSTASPAQSL